MLTYKDTMDESAVYLDKRRIGTIKYVSGGWRYFPKGSAKNAGEVMPSRIHVKRSLASNE